MKKAASFPKRCAAVPYSVVLFDEVEKAHPDVMHLLLQILEEGKITDNFGRKIDFRNTIIILTTNVGAESIKRQTTLGFGAIGQDSGDYDSMKDKVMEAAKKYFKPEFINRLDDLIVFRMLEKPELVRIVDLEISKVLDAPQARSASSLTLEESAREFLIEKGYDPAIRRAADAPRRREAHRGSARGAPAARRQSTKATPSRSCRTGRQGAEVHQPWADRRA